MCASFISASSTSIGGRNSQEDRIVVVPDLNIHVPAGRKSGVDPPTKKSFFAVFDGHGGQACSDFLCSRFHLELAQSPLLETDPKAALLDVWDSMDGKFYETCNQKSRHERGSKGGKMAHRSQRGGQASIDEFKASFPVDGSTATVVLIVGTKLFVANCGDSAGVLIRRDGSVKTLTADHGTLNPREIERVERSGGSFRDQVISVTRPFPLCCLRRNAVVGKPRAYPGGLLVTRAFGNFYSKVAALGGTPGVIIADCEQVLEMVMGEDWSELVIASDGVWDVLPVTLIPQVLEQLESTGANGPPSTRNNKRRAEDTRADEHDGYNAADRPRLEQALLNSKCAKLVLMCVRHRHWQEHHAVADNTSVIILQFQDPRSDTQADG